MTNPARLATRYARRPLLLEPNAALEILRHLQASDPRGMATESRFEAILRKVGLGRARPAAWDDDDGPTEEERAEQARKAQMYAPLWAQQAYGDPDDEGFCWSLYSGVAMMQVNTPLDANGEFYCGEWYHGYDTLLAALRDTDADSRVQARFIRMESPGGVVTGGLDELASYMRATRASAGGKPIHIHADMACSAAYYLAAQSDRISAPPVGLVGSIGAVIIHEDWSEALTKAGVAITSIQFGANKTDGGWWKKLSDEAKADFGAEVDQCGRDFVAAVAAGRPQLTSEALIGTNARVFMAQHDDPTRSGLALGFVDAIETEEQAFAAVLDRISGSNFPAPSFGPAFTAAQGSRGAQSTPKEDQMAAGQVKKGPVAALSRVLGSAKPAATAQAPAPKAASPGDPVTDPDEGMQICETCNGTGEVQEATCGDCDGEGQVEIIDQGERMASAPAAPASQAAGDHAQEIAASAEAKAHPAAALAAIQAGLTLQQFQAMAGVTSASAETPLDRRMRGAPRLGPDAAAAPEKGAMGSALLADAQAKREASGRR